MACRFGFMTGRPCALLPPPRSAACDSTSPKRARATWLAKTEDGRGWGGWGRGRGGGRLQSRRGRRRRRPTPTPNAKRLQPRRFEGGAG